MAYEDPIEAALRALTGVEWTKKKAGFEARINKTHSLGISQTLEDYGIAFTCGLSEARSGRYIVNVNPVEGPKILKTLETSGLEVKAHRKKWHS